MNSLKRENNARIDLGKTPKRRLCIICAQPSDAMICDACALEDWRQAEAEMVRSCCSGQMSVDGTLWMGTDAAVFKEDSIEIWVAPRQVTVCGKSRTGGDGQMIFHVINLTCDVDPSSVTAKIDGRSLDIFLKKAGAEHEAKRVMAAATA